VTKEPNRVGQIVGQRYELEAIIGRGGQGTVYRALDRWTKQTVAMKVLGAKAVREPHVLERLMREQQAMSALKGTAAVELFDVCRGNDGELCLVMELLQGMDLDEHLYELQQQKQRMPLTRVAEIFDPVVSTLEAAHAAGILHRDLKPANIFLTEGGGVRLLDFGMARLKKSAPLTAAGTVMGSPSFIAPEAWKGVSDLMDQRVDVYSLGVILFLVLSGELPFPGNTVAEKFVTATTSARPSLLKLRPDLPRDADSWVESALALDRDQRFGNVRALWNAFLSVFHVQPPNRAGRHSFWAAAKGAMQKLAGGSQPAPQVEPAESTNEPSFAREALARSAFQINATPVEALPASASATAPRRPDAGAAPGPRRPELPRRPGSARPAEATIELGEDDLQRVGLSPAKPPPPPQRAAEPPPVEKTFSMNDADFLYEQGPVKAPAPNAPVPAPNAPVIAPPRPAPPRPRRK
jgi:serine/threonine-protein kinase